MTPPDTTSAGLLATCSAVSALPLAVIDTDGEVLEANDAFSQLVGRPVEALLGLRLDELLGTTSGAVAEVREVTDGRRPMHRTECLVGRPGEPPFWGSLTVAAIRHGAPGGALVMLADESDRRRQEEEQRTLRDALSTAASEWRATFDAIEMPIFLVGGDGRIERLNRAARDLAGRDFPEILGRRPGELGQGRLWEMAEELVARAAREERADGVEVRDGATGRTWALSASHGLPDLSQERWVVLVAKETTGLVELRESLARSQRMAAMGTLLAGVAHEVRNPLFGISAVVDALERRVEGQGDLVQHMAALRRELARLEKLMSDLLDFGRPMTMEMAPVSVAHLLDDALVATRPTMGRSGVEVVAELPPLPPVEADRQRLVQALVNVLENAIQHSPAGSRVAVTGRALGIAGRSWVEVAVRDAGRGFAEADLARAFEPFFSRRPHGTGLGLPIVARIVEHCGGEVLVGNHPEGGALVRLRLKAATEAATTTPETQP
ncbi:MAG TPA: ATP-binding protein [Thermoanaerobaculia bacterium]|nr:ATP-binding protein [Thermoanaerobaculia bacterium]